MPLGALTHVFAGSALDRASDRRLDARWLEARLDDPTSWAVALREGRPLIEAGQTGGRLARLPADLAKLLAGDAEHLLFLGVAPDGAAAFAVDLDGETKIAAAGLYELGAFAELREAVAGLAPDEAAMAAAARAVFEWRRRHRFCAACGQPTRTADAGWRRRCPACDVEHFPRVDPVVIMLAVCGERCLLGRAPHFPPAWFSCLAGFMEPGETIEEACARELKEEAGLDTLSVRYHSSQPWPFPSSLMIGLTAEVADGPAAPDQTELEAVRWLTRAEAKALVRGELDGVLCPPPYAIAHHLIRTWADEG